MRLYGQSAAPRRGVGGPGDRPQGERRGRKPPPRGRAGDQGTGLTAAGRERERAAPHPRRTARTRAAAGQTPGRPGRASRTSPQAGEDGREHPAEAHRADPRRQPPQGRALEAVRSAAADAARAQRAEQGRGHPAAVGNAQQPTAEGDGAAILAPRKAVGGDLRAENARGPADLDPALRRGPHRRNHHQHRRHSQR